MSALTMRPILRARAILALAAVILMGAVAAHADGILGTWNVKMDYQGNLIPATLTFEKKDGAIAGRWKSERGENNLTNIKCEGNKLTFTRTIKFQDQEFELNYEGTVDGKKLTGKFVTPMGEMEANGELASAPEGAPAPAATAAVEPGMPGVWDLLVNSQLGENHRKLTVTKDLKGTYEGDFGKFETKNMKVDGDKVTFDLTLGRDGQELVLKFEGKLSGASLEGKFTSDMGDATVKGTKTGGGEAPKGGDTLSGAVNLPGKWKMSIETPDGGSNDGEMIVNKNGDSVSAVLTTQLGDIKIDKINVKGNAVDFQTTVDFGGTLVPIKFAGTSGGEKIKGTVSLDFNGQQMELPVNGTRSGDAGAAAPSGPADIAGTWNVEVETPDGAVSQATMNVTKDGAKYAAQLVTDLGEGKIPTIALDGNKVSFKTEIEFGGSNVPLSFDGTVGGEKLEGTLKATIDGQEMQLPLKGKKAAKAGLTGPVDVVGKWNVDVETPDGTVTQATLNVSKDGDKFAAQVTTELGEGKVGSIALDGNKVSFKTQVEFGGAQVPLAFDGTIGGEKLEGTIKATVNGQEMQLPIKGKKAAAAPGLTGPVDIVGQWNVEVETPDGAVSQATMNVTKDGAKFAAQLTTELGEGKVGNISVDGNKVSFKTEIEFGGSNVPLAFDGSVGGDKIEGTIKATIDGQDMQLPLKGKKAAAAPAKKETASACCSKSTCGSGCKGSAGCGSCCKG